jgi:hypothetical protein
MGPNCYSSCMVSYCGQPDCSKPVHARGVCKTHYARWLRTGDPAKVRRKVQQGPEPDRFWGFVDKTGDCWLWTGSLDRKGYGSWTRPEQRKIGAHRFAYQLVVGPIPEGLDLDHLCRVPQCVNPAHLEPVTRQVNIQRGANRNREKTHCKRGHEFTAENIYATKAGGRGCRACRAAYFEEVKRSRARKRRKD